MSLRPSPAGWGSGAAVAHAAVEGHARLRYAILYRLADAKKPETRARRLAQFVTMLKEGRKVYP